MAFDVWAIVLAAGAGRRLAPVTAGVPKQFWRPHPASRSLLDETLARLAPLAPPERTLTIVDRTHGPYVRSAADPASLGDVIYQPADRGTATGVLLPLLSVLHASPDAVVIVTPSDHAIEDAGQFRRGLRQAVAEVSARRLDIVLFGVEPTRAATDYGWITPSTAWPSRAAGFRSVKALTEKPPADEAARLLLSGAVWSTMVVVARASALVERYRRHLPFHHDILTAVVDVPSRRQCALLGEWYAHLPVADFSRDLLRPSTGLWLYTWPRGLGWSDLGTPERLARWLVRQSSCQTAPLESDTKLSPA